MIANGEPSENNIVYFAKYKFSEIEGKQKERLKIE